MTDDGAQVAGGTSIPVETGKSESPSTHASDGSIGDGAINSVIVDKSPQLSTSRPTTALRER